MSDKGGDFINDNDPAFPSSHKTPEGFRWYHGMSVRDYFAGQALMGLISGRNDSDSEGWVAQKSYRLADAMIVQRNK